MLVFFSSIPIFQKWWCDLWLKEGFASFMEYKFTADNYPEFNIWLNFVTMEMSRAINLDSMRSSHPIEVCPGYLLLS
jgi:aminopeptidase N